MHLWFSDILVRSPKCVQIGVANPRGHDLNADLVFTKCLQANVIRLQRPAHVMDAHRNIGGFMCHLGLRYAEAVARTGSFSAAARNIRMGISPLIDPGLVARAYTAVSTLPTPCDLVL